MQSITVNVWQVVLRHLLQYFLPILIGGTGLALDVGESTHVRQRLCSALDASVLAGASSSMDDDEIEDTINEYFDENYPDDAIGVSSDLDVDVGDNEVTDAKK